jgi:flagellar motor switch/type III secretory pathway protein FliN
MQMLPQSPQKAAGNSKLASKQQPPTLSETHKKKKTFKQHKCARTRQKTPQQPPATTKTTFNGQKSPATIEMVVDLEVAVDLEIG